MFHTVFYVPLYNALIFLTALFGGSLGWAVIGLTLVIKLILSPLSHRSIMSQIEQKKLQPLLEDIKKKYPDKKEQQEKTMELYKEHKTNPFAGCVLILIQLPILIALYRVFMSGAAVNVGDLYGFVAAPEAVAATFLGISMTSKSILLGVLAGITQFLQMHLSPSLQQPSAPSANKDAQSAMMASMSQSMKYTMPVMIAAFALAVPGAVALYWVVSNLFMIAQERFVMWRQNRSAQKTV